MAVFEQMGMNCPANIILFPQHASNLKYNLNDIPTYSRLLLISAIERIVTNLSGDTDMVDIINRLGDSKSLELIGQALTKCVQIKKDDYIKPIVITNFPNDIKTKMATIQICLENNASGYVEVFDDSKNTIIMLIDKLGRTELIFFDNNINSINCEFQGDIQASLYDGSYGLRKVINDYCKEKSLSFFTTDNMKFLCQMVELKQTAKDLEVIKKANYFKNYPGSIYTYTYHLYDDIINDEKFIQATKHL
jgi:hypothetical protein